MEQTKITFDIDIEFEADPKETYDAIEIHPVRQIEDGLFEQCEGKDAEFYSVYLHLKSGGVTCIANCKDYVTAQTLETLLLNFAIAYKPQTQSSIPEVYPEPGTWMYKKQGFNITIGNESHNPNRLHDYLVCTIEDNSIQAENNAKAICQTINAYKKQ